MTGEGPRLEVLALVGRRAAPLVGWLRQTCSVTVAGAAGFRRPAGRQVVLAESRRPLAEAEAEILAGHVRAGGGMVLLGPTLGVWGRGRAISELAGWVPGEPGPPAELLVRPEPGTLLADRLDPELRLRDRLPLGDPPPADASPLLQVSWRFDRRPAGFLRRAGGGRWVWLGLGWEPGVFAEEVFRQMVHRSLWVAAGLSPPPPLGVGLYGYGAIGREHAESVQQTPGLELRGICDSAPPRRQAAAGRFGVPTHADAHRLLADPAIDVVVVGVPPVLHCAAVLDCLAAAKHVVCEKPFALRRAEVDRMLDAAGVAGRLVTVYQSRRWDPDFLALRRAVRGGAIGRPFYMESFIGGYGHPCDYWHSHEPVSGGTIYDWGSHYLDWVLQLFDGPVRAVGAQAHKRVWHDVTNADQVSVELTFAGGEQASFLQSDVAAARKPKWYVLGTAGAVVGEWRRERLISRAWTGDLVEEHLQPAEAPAEMSLHRPDGAGGISVETLALPRRPVHPFHRNLADHLLLGEPLAVPAGEAGRNVDIMEAATRSIAAGGRRLRVRI